LRWLADRAPALVPVLVDSSPDGHSASSRAGLDGHSASSRAGLDGHSASSRAGLDGHSASSRAGAHVRILLAHVPGEDRYDGGLAVRDAIHAAFHPVQVASASCVDELLAAGTTDYRTPALLDRVRHVVATHGDHDPRLRELVDTLPARLAEV